MARRGLARSPLLIAWPYGADQIKRFNPFLSNATALPASAAGKTARKSEQPKTFFPFSIFFSLLYFSHFSIFPFFVFVFCVLFSPLCFHVFAFVAFSLFHVMWSKPPGGCSTWARRKGCGDHSSGRSGFLRRPVQHYHARHQVAEQGRLVR